MIVMMTMGVDDDDDHDDVNDSDHEVIYNSQR